MSKLGNDDLNFRWDDYDFSSESNNIFKRHMSIKHANNLGMQKFVKKNGLK